MKDSERIAKLIDWAEDNGWHVDFEHPGPIEGLLPLTQRHVDEMNPKIRVITIDSKQSKRSQVYALLHECGHIMDDRRTMVLFTGRYGGKSKRDRCTVIENEFNAWKHGWALSQQLGFELSSTAYENVAAKYLMRYINRKGLLVS